MSRRIDTTSSGSVPERRSDAWWHRCQRYASALVVTSLLGAGLASCSNSTGGSPTGASGSSTLAGASCRRRVADTTVTHVTKDTALDNAWTAYGDSNQGWAAGDSVHGYRLGSGTTLWTFADTFLGPIGPNGSQSPSKPLYHSTFVIEHDGQFRTIVGGTKAHPASLITTANPYDIYLGLAGLVADHQLQEIFLNDVAGPHTTLYQKPTGTLLGVFSVPSMHLERVVHLPAANRSIQWGAAITRSGAYTYVYGATSGGGDKKLYVARVLGTDLLGSWRFWTGSRWSVHQAHLAPIASGVSDEVSVTEYDGMSVLVTTPTTVAYSAAIDFELACSPTGPFHVSKTILASYYTGAIGEAKYGIRDVYVYDAMDQASLNAGSTWLVSFDRNDLLYGLLARNVTVYRPSYLLVKIVPRPPSSS